MLVRVRVGKCEIRLGLGLKNPRLSDGELLGGTDWSIVDERDCLTGKVLIVSIGLKLLTYLQFYPLVYSNY